MLKKTLETKKKLKSPFFFFLFFFFFIVNVSIDGNGTYFE